MAGTALPTVIGHRSRGIVRTEVALTCDASGDVPLTVIGVGFGRLVGFLYNGGLDASAVVTIKDTKSGATLVAYTTLTEGVPTSFRPTTVIVDQAGTAPTPSTSANKLNRDMYVGGKVSVTVASGGTSETGIIALIVDEAGVGDLALTV